MTSKYVAYKEFRDSIGKIDEKINKLEIDLTALKVKFNDELKITINSQTIREKWKFGGAMAILSGIISFMVALAFR